MMESDNEEKIESQEENQDLDNLDSNNQDSKNEDSNNQDSNKEDSKDEIFDDSKNEAEQVEPAGEDEPSGLDLHLETADETEVETAASGPWIRISNLQRPFTAKGLERKIVESGGEISNSKTDVWLNSIKSMAFVKISNHEDAHEKVIEAMNGKTWPESSTKQLSLEVVDQAIKDECVLIDEGGMEKNSKPVTDHGANYEKNLKQKSRSRSRSPVKRPERRRSPTPKRDETVRRMNTDEIDKKFKRTKAEPYIYWKPKKELESN